MFNCSKCSEDVEGGKTPECSMCQQSQCQECLDDDGVCIPCGYYDI